MTTTENLTNRPNSDDPDADAPQSQGRALRLAAAVARLLLGFTFLWALYAITLVMIACMAGAGTIVGFGGRWAKTQIVRRHPMLR